MDALWAARDTTGDVSFELDDGTVYMAHRCVLLLGRIAWFAVCLTTKVGGGASEAKKRVREMRAPTFGVALKYAYSIPIGMVTAASLFEAAHYFSAPDMLKGCLSTFGHKAAFEQMCRYEPMYDAMAKTYGRLTDEAFVELPVDVRVWYMSNIRMTLGLVIAHASDPSIAVDDKWLVAALERCDYLGASARVDSETTPVWFIKHLIAQGIWDPREACKLYYYSGRSTIVRLHPLRVCLTQPHSDKPLDDTIHAIYRGQWTREGHVVVTAGPKQTPVYIGSHIDSYKTLSNYIIYDCWYNEG